MELIVKGADFSANSVVKIYDNIFTSVSKSFVGPNGEIATTNNWNRTPCFAITDAMRQNGLYLYRVKSHNGNQYPAVAFYNSDTPSSSTLVGVLYCNDYTTKEAYIYPEQIPEGATHCIMNGMPNNNGFACTSSLLDVVDYDFADGYITPSGGYNTNSDFTTSDFIPVDSNASYFCRPEILATYDKDGNFIARTSGAMSTLVLGKITFNSDVAFIRIGGLKSDIPFFCKV